MRAPSTLPSTTCSKSGRAPLRSDPVSWTMSTTSVGPLQVCKIALADGSYKCGICGVNGAPAIVALTHITGGFSRTLRVEPGANAGSVLQAMAAKLQLRDVSSFGMYEVHDLVGAIYIYSHVYTPRWTGSFICPNLSPLPSVAEEHKVGFLRIKTDVTVSVESLMRDQDDVTGGQKLIFRQFH